jgi:hypothetical protein
MDILSTSWDIVIVDGPSGYHKGEPERIQSLYAATELTRPPSALTVVDDCERQVVRTYADLFYDPDTLFLAVLRSPRFVPSAASTTLYMVATYSVFTDIESSKFIAFFTCAPRASKPLPAALPGAVSRWGTRIYSLTMSHHRFLSMVATYSGFTDITLKHTGIKSLPH